MSPLSAHTRPADKKDSLAGEEGAHCEGHREKAQAGRRAQVDACHPIPFILHEAAGVVWKERKKFRINN